MDAHDERRIAAAEPADVTRGAVRLMLASIGFCFACMVLLAIRRAGWLDEYWTVWHTDPANAFRIAYWTRWIHDTQHPPTFYALSWWLAPLTGPTLVARRLVTNDLAWFIVVGTILACRRGRGVAVQPLLFALLMASGPYFVTYFAEHRSYFLGLAAAACLVATVRKLHLETAEGRPLRRGLALWLFVNEVIALNLHYTLSLCLLTLLGVECLWQWMTGHRARSLIIAGCTAAALVPLLANFATALSLHRPVTVANTGLITGGVTIAFMLAVGFVVNVALLIHAWPAAMALLRRPRLSGVDGGLSFVALLIIVLLLLTCAFVGLHAISRNMYPRLLLGLIPLGSAALAELAARRTLTRTVVAIACLNATAVAAATTVHELRNPRWEQSAPVIADAYRRCPGTRVIAYDTLYLVPHDSSLWQMRGQAEAMALSYRMIARKYGFPVHVAPVDGTLPAAKSPCPTFVWLEHNFFRGDLGAAELAARAGVSLADTTYSFHQGMATRCCA